MRSMTIGDGEIDNDATDTLALYVDQDGDGYGAQPALLEDDTPQFSCFALAGYSFDSTDCDDESTTYVSFEIDFDCDGAIGDEDCDEYDDSLSFLTPT